MTEYKDLGARDPAFLAAIDNYRYRNIYQQFGELDEADKRERQRLSQQKMREQVAGDEFFDDDDLDDLPHNALEELESNAIQATQAQTQVPAFNQPPSSDYGDEFEDDDLDDADVYDETQGIPKDIQPIPVPGNIISNREQHREQFRQAQYGARNAHPAYITGRPLSQGSQLPDRRSVQPSASVSRQAEKTDYTQPGPNITQATNSLGVETLQQQIRDLLKTQESLKQDLSAKAGEIAIVRSKQEKSEKEHQRELNAIRKQSAERLASQQMAIEAAREAEKARATELEFIKRDLQDEADKVRNLKRAGGKDKPNSADLLMTPRKNKSALHRDGFDDEEVQIISPSKFHGRRSAGNTPTKPGIKRKRKINDSPVKESLDVEQEQMPTDDNKLQSNGVILDEALLERLRRPDDRLEFLQTILDHRLDRQHLRTIEEFGKYSLLQGHGETFSSIILGKLPALGNKQATDFPIEFCELLLSLWGQCLEQKYYAPIYLLIDLVVLCLELKTSTIAPEIIDLLLPVAQDTAELVGILRFKRESYSLLEKDIDVSACLQVLHLAAQGCMNGPVSKIRFWKLIRVDFVLMILSQHQPIRDFDLMLQLLSMSCMNDSIGPKALDQDAQQDQIGYIIDRMSLLLVTLPTVEQGKEAYDWADILNLRMQILRTFQAFCQTSWGGEAVAKHRYAIGRMVKLTSDELDVIYDYQSAHTQSSQLVCLATRILHHIILTHDRTIDMQEKLAVIHGGSQKYLICLARLNFAEDDLLLEEKIDPEVSNCALELLELAVTPEEGDAIHAAFSGSQ